MENYPIKSVAFGGFDKQDVIAYIQKTVEEASAAQKQLTEERDALEQQLDAAKAECAALRQQLGEAERKRESMERRLSEESSAREALAPLQPEVEQLRARVEALKAEADSLRPDAEAYVQFREKVGAIECEAHKRATELEKNTAAQLRRTVDLFRQQYQVLMSTFEATASHVTGELRKVEVNLTQLPRAMDQSGLELNELAAQLERKKED